MEPELLSVLKGLHSCSACTARREALNPVPPIGSKEEESIMIVGRNPGREENEKGEPFVGKAGKYLNGYLEKLGLRRDEVYITNTVKCYTKNNREPDILEINICRERWLLKEFKALRPRLLILLGADAFRGIHGYNISPFIDNCGVRCLPEKGFYEVILPHPSAVVSYHPAWGKIYDDSVGRVKAIIGEIGEESK
jgi:DNA polymerase